MGRHTVIKQKNEMIRQIELTSMSVKNHLPNSFKYSRLALSLSVCLMAQLCAQQNAYGQTIQSSSDSDSNVQIGKGTQRTGADRNNGLASAVTSSTEQEQLEEALIALKLKQAVERGLIDESVLEDYKRETLNTPVPSRVQNAAAQAKPKQDSTIKNTPAISNRNVNGNNPLVSKKSNVLESFDNRPRPVQSNSTNLDVADNMNQKFDNTLADSDISHSEAEGSLGIDEQSISTPEELEQTLAQIEVSDNLESTLPVATLDSTELPIGLDRGADDLGLIQPNNRKTLGLDDIVAVNSENESINHKDASIKPTNKKGSQESSDTNISAAADSSAGIDPDQYLPEYDETSAKNLADTTVTSANKETADVNETGFFKGLYNRLFNDGYASLPKIKAKVFIPDNRKQDSSGNPLLVEADKDSQPASNIKAAMENITIESISDFTAAMPKLREVSTNAAQAVGYYDINMRFERVDQSHVNVIINKLGKPVQVNSRIVDIRGDGSDLPEYQSIAENAAPLEASTFNHGQYIKTKSDIETVAEDFGFFDGQWLNKSVDIILPDNTADVDLIYDTGKRYKFDEVVFYTIDKEAGKLTTDPDKLPVKPELLHQLYDFEKGDDFYRPLITDFANNLSETRYFNAVNVESVRPVTLDSNNSTLGFENQDNIDDGEGIDNDTDKSVLVDQQADTNALQDDTEMQPIEYSIDDQTSERLQAIKTKAERLSQLPDDRVLDTEKEDAKSLLGKVSNAISNAVEKILPDDEDDLSDAQILANGAQSRLDNRKTSEDVAENKAVPLYVFVTADKPKDVDLGIGYGTDTGVRAVARLEHNLINRDGYQAGIEVGASEINKSISLHAKRPWKHPLDDTLSARLSFVQKDANQGKGNLDLLTNTIEAGLARKIRSDSGWNRTYSVRYRLDELESGIKGTKRADLPVPFNRESAQFDQQALLLGYAIDKTSTDDLTNPTKGWHQFYSIEAGSENVVTDTNMAIARAGINGVYSFGDYNRHQLVGSIEGGYIWADDFNNVPYMLRFFAGGDRSIRGYDYNSLSPLEKGYLTGGQVLALGSTEYNYEFKPGLRGAVFADVGNAYDTDFSNDTKLGVGVGVRWASPVGMVRLDLAAGVLEDSIPVRLHFFIGSPLQ